MMKKILVLSDSHGNVEHMKMAVEQIQPDMIIHLGDCWSDTTLLREEYPDILLEQVPGNCDGPNGALEKVLLIEGKKILICHGHTFNVKAGYLRLELAAKEREADIALCGHTHSPFFDYHNGLRILNPGSIGVPRYGNPPSYGLITLNEDTKEVVTDICFLE